MILSLCVLISWFVLGSVAIDLLPISAKGLDHTTGLLKRQASNDVNSQDGPSLELLDSESFYWGGQGMSYHSRSHAE
jgi:hypothetical protein